MTEGQALLELETEKATVPVPSPAAGKVARWLVREGDHVKVGQALVELEGAGCAQPDKPLRRQNQRRRQPPQAPRVEAAHAKAVEQREQPPAEQLLRPQAVSPSDQIGQRPNALRHRVRTSLPPPPSDGLRASWESTSHT